MRVTLFFSLKDLGEWERQGPAWQTSSGGLSNYCFLANRVSGLASREGTAEGPLEGNPRRLPLLPSKPSPSCTGGRGAGPVSRVRVSSWCGAVVRPGSPLQASLFTADSLIRLAGIRSGKGDAGPLMETNKSSQVLERDCRDAIQKVYLESPNKPRGRLHSLPAPLGCQTQALRAAGSDGTLVWHRWV